MVRIRRSGTLLRMDRWRKTFDRSRQLSNPIYTKEKEQYMECCKHKKVEGLIEKGLMQEAGLVSFNHRTEDKSKIYSFENEEVKFSPELEAIFKSNKAAWDYFQSLAPTYRKPSSNWVMSAKQEATRLKRLHELIADSEKGTNKWKYNKYKK